MIRQVSHLMLGTALVLPGTTAWAAPAPVPASEPEASVPTTPVPAAKASAATVAQAASAAMPPPRPAARAPVPPALNGGLHRVAIDIGRQPVGEQGRPEFRLNQALGSALARELIARQVIVVAIPPGASPIQRARAAEGSQLLLSVNHEVLPDAQREQARRASGFKLALASRQATDPVALPCARGVALALAKGGRPNAAAVVPVRPLLDVALGVQRQDDLAVLNAATVPALRLQVAVLANPAEARQAKGGNWVDGQARLIGKALGECLGVGSVFATAPALSPASPGAATARPAQPAPRGRERANGA